jgi:hypothetical protein
MEIFLSFVTAFVTIGLAATIGLCIASHFNTDGWY